MNPTSWVLSELPIRNHPIPTDLDVLKLGVLWQPNEAIKQAERTNECNGELCSLIKRLDHSKDRDYNIHRGVPIVPQLV